MKDRNRQREKSEKRKNSKNLSEKKLVRIERKTN